MAREYQKGEYVCYGTNGVCLIEDVREVDVARNKETFYVLRPLRDPHSMFFIPVQNEALTQKMRLPVSCGEIDVLLNAVRRARDEWIDDRKTRMEFYRETLRISDPRDLLRLCKMLYLQKQSLADLGKQLAPTDENVFKQVQELMRIEFGLALQIAAEEVEPYLLQRIITE